MVVLCLILDRNYNSPRTGQSSRMQIKTRRCGGVYLGVVVLNVCEVCYVYQGYVGSAVLLYIRREVILEVDC